jgi:predicted acylesterase/phospholipase RssA
MNKTTRKGSSKKARASRVPITRGAPVSRLLLQDLVPPVDVNKIGISYSGGGPLVLVELGIAQAFVDKGIIPAVIAGASAGAIAAAAHALDVHGGQGIAMAAALLSTITSSQLGLDVFDFLGRLGTQREHIASVGDNASIGPLIKNALVKTFNLTNVTIGTFIAPQYPKLMVVATDLTDSTALWFPDETSIEDALIASSAIPGVFPWRLMKVNGSQVTLVDGGAVDNQPISTLIEQECGTIYACSVGSTGPQQTPSNALDNIWQSINLMMHQSSRLEEEYVRLRLGNQGTINHIHPDVSFPSQLQSFDFASNPKLVQNVIQDARAKTGALLS